MWSFADRVVKTVSDVTVGTVIVLVHVALADRRARQDKQRGAEGRERGAEGRDYLRQPS
jgi:hypothetical protein